MGRLCGIPHFLSEEAYAEEKLDDKVLRRAKKELAELKSARNVVRSWLRGDPIR